MNVMLMGDVSWSKTAQSRRSPSTKSNTLLYYQSVLLCWVAADSVLLQDATEKTILLSPTMTRQSIAAYDACDVSYIITLGRQYSLQANSKPLLTTTY